MVQGALPATRFQNVPEVLLVSKIKAPIHIGRQRGGITAEGHRSLGVEILNQRLITKKYNLFVPFYVIE